MLFYGSGGMYFVSVTLLVLELLSCFFIFVHSSNLAICPFLRNGKHQSVYKMFHQAADSGF